MPYKQSPTNIRIPHLNLGKIKPHNLKLKKGEQEATPKKEDDIIEMQTMEDGEQFE